MVAINDVSRIAELYRQRSTVDSAIKMFDHGARITAFGLGPPNVTEEQFSPPPVMVDTSDMEYPAQMVETIKSLLNTRLKKIYDDLAALGVTGMVQGDGP